ncbi:MAG TPA: outer membrane lipoprotein carrier protein LolA [Bacteroidales bacterium]
MLNKLGFLAIAVLINFSVYSQKTDDFALAQNTEEIKQKIAASSAEINSLSSNFTQEKHLTMMEEVLVSKGNFQFKKENKVRWTYTQPIDYAIIINENQFIILNEGKVSTFDISSNRMFSEINQMIVMAIKGNFVDSKEFKAAFFENKEFYKIALTPVNEQVASMLNSIEIYFDKKDMSVGKVKFIEPGDDFTLITFTDRKLNSNIPDKTFSLKNE